MRVLTGREMASLDARAQTAYGLSGLILMENAGREVAALVAARYGPRARIGIVCGPGNNGGDGLVAGRHLLLAGHQVDLWLGAEEAGYRGAALVNLGIVGALGLSGRQLRGEAAGSFREALQGYDVVIDAFFGTGFHGVPRPEAAAVLRAVNEAGRPVVAVDIPSGVDADSGAVAGEAVKADLTVTFALPKLGCLLHPGAGYCGELVVVPISLPPPEADDEAAVFLVEARDVLAVMPRRPRDSHKGLNGRILVVGGSPGLTGAPFLAARGALRAGAGLVTVLLPAGVAAPEKPAEVMLGVQAETAPEALLASADVVAAGPGMGQTPDAWERLGAILHAWRGPLVLDADALNLLAAHRAAVGSDRGTWVLTPHPGEMARLTGLSVARVQADRVGTARRAAEEWRSIVVLKGAPTVVAEPAGRVWLNPTGDPAMATGGMGDVLTGAIAGLIGQGVRPADAALSGVYLHGLAGSLAAGAAGGPGVLAGEVADLLPAAARKVRTECHGTKR